MEVVQESEDKVPSTEESSIFKQTNGYQKGYPNHKWIYFNHYLTLLFFKVMQIETIKRLLPIQIAGKTENTRSLQGLEVKRIYIDR